MPGAELDSQAGAFQIRVLEGELSVAQLQPGETAGVIKLSGRAGPLQGLVYEGSHRVKTTYYPGNQNGSQQALGATDKPMVVAGEWNDRFLGDGAAMGLMNLLDDVRARGVSVEVSWGGAISGSSATGSALVRVGVITNAKFSPVRVQDVPWELTFEWRGRGTPTAPAITATPKLNPRQDVADATDDLEMSSAMWTAYSQGPVSQVGFSQLVEQVMANAQDSIETAVAALQSGQSAIQAATVIPTQAALRMIGAAEDAVASVRLMERTLLETPLLLVEVRDSALDLLRVTDDVFTQLLQHGQSKETCLRVRDGVVDLVEPDVVAAVDAPAGTSYRDLALRYYGDPDLGWAIAQFNDADGMSVPSQPDGPGDTPPRPTYIPRVQPGATSDLRAQC